MIIFSSENSFSSGVGLERRGLVREGLAAGEEELAQNARRWTTLGVSPFEIETEAGRRTWRQLLLAIEKDLVLAGAHPGMVADNLADYLFAHSTGHFASLLTLIAPGLRTLIDRFESRSVQSIVDVQPWDHTNGVAGGMLAVEAAGASTQTLARP